MIRWRSLFRVIASISLAAEGLMTTLYLATPLQVPDDIFEDEIWLVCSILERGEILRIFGQRQLDCFVYEIGYAPIHLCRLHPQRAMDIGVEVDRGSFLHCAHSKTE